MRFGGGEGLKKKGAFYSLIFNLCGVGELTHFWTEVAKKANPRGDGTERSHAFNTQSGVPGLREGRSDLPR